MHHVALSDQAYRQAQKRASKAGFKTVEEYLEDLVEDDASLEAENVDHLFTAERLAHIDSVIAKVKAGGKTHTASEVQEHFRKRFEG